VGRDAAACRGLERRLLAVTCSTALHMTQRAGQPRKGLHSSPPRSLRPRTGRRGAWPLICLPPGSWQTQPARCRACAVHRQMHREVPQRLNEDVDALPGAVFGDGAGSVAGAETVVCRMAGSRACLGCTPGGAAAGLGRSVTDSRAATMPQSLAAAAARAAWWEGTRITLRVSGHICTIGGRSSCAPPQAQPHSWHTIVAWGAHFRSQCL
jgi:hypothetical protein